MKNAFRDWAGEMNKGMARGRRGARTKTSLEQSYHKRDSEIARLCPGLERCITCVCLAQCDGSGGQVGMLGKG